MLASDEDLLIPTARVEKVVGTHPDVEKKLSFLGLGKGSGIVLSRWQSRVSAERSPIDLNYAFTDGSVRRFGDVHWNDPRMARAPLTASAPQTAAYWVHLPPQPAP